MSANGRQVGGEHYNKQKIQHWDYVIANGVPYMEAQIIKYVSRWRDKNGVEDLQKAKHFLEKLIEVETSPGPLQEVEVTSTTDATRRTVPVISQLMDWDGIVKATGWARFTYEGTDGYGSLYRCIYCREHLRIPPGTSPHAHHQCGAEPTAAYVNQGD